MHTNIRTVDDLIPHILYEDKDILVLHKCAGIAVQSKDVFQADLTSLLKAYLPGGYVGLVQRLDQPVEGILVFGKNKRATALLHDQITNHLVGKNYQAVVVPQEDAPVLYPGEDDEHELRDFLYKTPGQNVSQVVEKNYPGAKESFLSYRTLAVLSPQEDKGTMALLSIRLGTGRHHQIRVQLSHAHLPILGDMKYGVKSYRGLGLCATSLEFTHPVTGKMMSFEHSPEGNSFAPFYP